eukprot:TRINITY_DN33740_c0_g1_i1.p2 TRINITY_DN33740_c0_g1~~TRINITY_DN33740_c0_g1_i1.p2  ORF type:complete len:153 (+),score=42.09 TRINITY_DN33740_c0_g1_i1:115-573(+)
MGKFGNNTSAREARARKIATTEALHSSAKGHLSAAADTERAWLSQPQVVGLGSSDRGTCHVYGATEVAFVGGRCVAAACIEPLTLADGQCILGIHDDSDDGVDMTTSAIVGVVVGCVAFVALVVLITCCVMRRRSQPAAGSKNTPDKTVEEA